YTDNASINDWTIRNLNPSKTYEYTITPQCQTLQGQATDIATFVTPSSFRADANCDTPVATTTGLPKTARAMLLPGEEYAGKGGKLKLIMDQVTKQSNGKFSGVGSSNFGFFPAMFAVEVTDLAVDMDGKLLDGKLKTITYGVYVIDAATYAQAEQTLNFAGTLLNGNPPSDANLAILQDTLRSIRNLPPAAAALIQQGIADIKSGNTASGKATVQQGLAQAKTELSRSANKGGNVIGGGNSNGKELKPLAGLNIRFSNAPESAYGFDAKVHDELASTYEQENGTYIPWKAIESGRTDPLLVTVSISGSRIKRDSIRYATQSGARIPLVNNRLSPVGASEGIKTELYALYPTTGSGTQNVAQVNLVGYTKEINTVVIVPLGADLPMSGQAITDSLNRIFGQAVAGFSVEVKPVFRPSGWNGTVSIGGTGMLSAYTPSQRNIINAYKASTSDFSTSKYYIFVGGTPSDPSIKGYMPRARKYGFIFDRNTTAKTLAHELGHGVFHLQHAFDEKSLPREGDNLMSYGTGTRLHKYQWDKVHNPELVIGVLEEDSSGMLRTIFNSKYIILENKFKDKVTKTGGGRVDFLTPEAIAYAEGKLAELDKLGKKTYIYLSYKTLPK
ncbi:MAG: hypothetical protein K2Q22_10065, partial [Cytophagales bacterium]|nr:hypothetical protein [Cytophagales bacterium]